MAAEQHNYLASIEVEVNMESIPNIDFVITWVDDTDPVWRKKKEKCTGIAMGEGNSDVRYRDWDTLKYWFRGVEKFAPWVRYVFFITDNQKPEWLNVDHPKLKWIKHSDYIPQEYLPTFNSHTIEWNFHKIPELSETFVYFNDDMFLINHTVPEDFFRNGQPCDLPCLGPLYPNGFFSRILFNNIDLLNRHFSLRNSIAKHPMKWIRGQGLGGILKLFLYGRRHLIPNSVNHHIQSAMTKESFRMIWETEYELVHQTCSTPLRTVNDISLYCARDWQIFSGEFYPKKPIGKYFRTASMGYNSEALSYLEKQKGKAICLNDTEDEQDFELHKKLTLQAFEKILPEKSMYEL